MNDFDYDVLQKKRVAASARRRVCGSKSRYCGLPSDHLTPAQIKKRSGPVMSYSLNSPMDYPTFKSMPKDLQQAYLDGLHSRFGVGASRIGEDLFNLGKTSLNNYIRTVGLKPIGSKGSRLTKEMEPVWERWLNPVEEPVEEPVTDEAPIEETVPIEEPTPYGLPVLSVTRPSRAGVEQESLDKLLNELQMPTVAPVKSTITMEPRVEEFSVSDLSATFTGNFDPERFLKWVSMLPMPEGDVRIHVEVATR